MLVVTTNIVVIVVVVFIDFIVIDGNSATQINKIEQVESAIQ